VPPAGFQGAEPPVMGQGAEAPLKLSPPEAECLFAFAYPKEAANLTNYVHAELVELQCKENIINIIYS